MEPAADQADPPVLGRPLNRQQKLPPWCRVSPWTLSAVLLLALLLLPLAHLALEGAFSPASAWKTIAGTVLPTYTRNTLFLLVGVSTLTLLFGVSTAWLVSFYSFPGRTWLSGGLVLPFAIPTYIAAYAYVGLLDYTGPLQTALRNAGVAVNARWFDVKPLPGSIFILSVVLFPYVYLITRASFALQSARLLEISRSLGRPLGRSFFAVALPLARPAIIGGLGLVTMEVLNEFGAVKYLGLTTFSLGIFNAWTGYDELGLAIRLAGLLLLLVVVLAGVERLLRGRKRFEVPSGELAPVRRVALVGWRGWSATFLCAIPFALGFVLPVGQLLHWFWRTVSWKRFAEFSEVILNTVVLSGGASLLVVGAALMIAYATRTARGSRCAACLRHGALLGYACPGAVIAIGVMLSLGMVTTRLFSTLVVGIVFAYTVRFLAVAFSAIDGSFERVAGGLDEASRGLGRGRAYTLARVYVPMCRGALLSAGILVFVDILKELPMTVILCPPNFETLATITYRYAGEEMVAEAATGALLIVLVGLVPVLVANRLMGRSATSVEV